MSLIVFQVSYWDFLEYGVMLGFQDCTGILYTAEDSWDWDEAGVQLSTWDNPRDALEFSLSVASASCVEQKDHWSHIMPNPS